MLVVGTSSSSLSLEPALLPCLWNQLFFLVFRTSSWFLSVHFISAYYGRFFLRRRQSQQYATGEPPSRLFKLLQDTPRCFRFEMRLIFCLSFSRVLMEIGARALSTHIRVFADFLVYEVSTAVAGEHVNIVSFQSFFFTLWNKYGRFFWMISGPCMFL